MRKKQPKNPHVQRHDWTGCVMNGNVANTAGTEFRSLSVSQYGKGGGGWGGI